MGYGEARYGRVRCGTVDQDLSRIKTTRNKQRLSQENKFNEPAIKKSCTRKGGREGKRESSSSRCCYAVVVPVCALPCGCCLHWCCCSCCCHLVFEIRCSCWACSQWAVGVLTMGRGPRGRARFARATSAERGAAALAAPVVFGRLAAWWLGVALGICVGTGLHWYWAEAPACREGDPPPPPIWIQCREGDPTP